MDYDENDSVQELKEPDINEIKLNSYFKYSANINSFRKLSNLNNTPKDTSVYVSLTDPILTPFLFNFFSSSNNFLHSDFYKLSIDNFQSLNDKELNFII